MGVMSSASCKTSVLLCLLALVSHAHATVDRTILTSRELQRKVTGSFYVLGYCASLGSECYQLSKVLEAIDAQLQQQGIIKHALLLYDPNYWSSQLNTTQQTNLWFACSDGHELSLQSLHSQSRDCHAASSSHGLSSTGARSSSSIEQKTFGPELWPHKSRLQRHKRHCQRHRGSDSNADCASHSCQSADSLAAAMPWYANSTVPVNTRVDILVAAISQAVQQQGMACAMKQLGVQPAASAAPSQPAADTVGSRCNWSGNDECSSSDTSTRDTGPSLYLAVMMPIVVVAALASCLTGLAHMRAVADRSCSGAGSSRQCQTSRRSGSSVTGSSCINNDGSSPCSSSKTDTMIGGPGTSNASKGGSRSNTGIGTAVMGSQRRNSSHGAAAADATAGASTDDTSNGSSYATVVPPPAATQGNSSCNGSSNSGGSSGGSSNSSGTAVPGVLGHDSGNVNAAGILHSINTSNSHSNVASSTPVASTSSSSNDSSNSAIPVASSGTLCVRVALSDNLDDIHTIRAHPDERVEDFKARVLAGFGLSLHDVEAWELLEMIVEQEIQDNKQQHQQQQQQWEQQYQGQRQLRHWQQQPSGETAASASQESINQHVPETIATDPAAAEPAAAAAAPVGMAGTAAAEPASGPADQLRLDNQQLVDLLQHMHREAGEFKGAAAAATGTLQQQQASMQEALTYMQGQVDVINSKLDATSSRVDILNSRLEGLMASGSLRAWDSAVSASGDPGAAAAALSSDVTAATPAAGTTALWDQQRQPANQVDIIDLTINSSSGTISNSANSGVKDGQPADSRLSSVTADDTGGGVAAGAWDQAASQLDCLVSSWAWQAEQQARALLQGLNTTPAPAAAPTGTAPAPDGGADISNGATVGGWGEVVSISRQSSVGSIPSLLFAVADEAGTGPMDTATDCTEVGGAAGSGNKLAGGQQQGAATLDSMAAAAAAAAVNDASRAEVAAGWGMGSGSRQSSVSCLPALLSAAANDAAAETVGAGSGTKEVGELTGSMLAAVSDWPHKPHQRASAMLTDTPAAAAVLADSSAAEAKEFGSRGETASISHQSSVMSIPSVLSAAADEGRTDAANGKQTGGSLPSLLSEAEAADTAPASTKSCGICGSLSALEMAKQWDEAIMNDMVVAAGEDALGCSTTAGGCRAATARDDGAEAAVPLSSRSVAASLLPVLSDMADEANAIPAAVSGSAGNLHSLPASHWPEQAQQQGVANDGNIAADTVLGLTGDPLGSEAAAKGAIDSSADSGNGNSSFSLAADGSAGDAVGELADEEVQPLLPSGAGSCAHSSNRCSSTSDNVSLQDDSVVQGDDTVVVGAVNQMLALFDWPDAVTAGDGNEAAVNNGFERSNEQASSSNGSGDATWPEPAAACGVALPPCSAECDADSGWSSDGWQEVVVSADDILASVLDV